MARRILIVEDERIVAEDLRVRLEQFGYEIMGITDSGRNAIELITKNPPDAVIMDIRVDGDLDGVETAIVLQSRPETNVPVIFLTAFSRREFPVLAALDKYAYIKKPFTDQELLEALRSCLTEKTS